MYRRESRYQLSFESFFVPFGGKLSWETAGSSWLSSFLGMSWKVTMQQNSARALMRLQSRFVSRPVHVSLRLASAYR
jgi:hypothetical protein